MNNGYQINWHHELIAHKLEDALKKVENNERVRIILEVPPRYGKTELATINFPAWILGKKPDLPIIVSSYNTELAESFGLKTRDLLNDDIYKLVFETRLREDTTARGRWLTDSGGGYTSTGIGGSITGRGFKVGIIDDPIKNREDAESQIKRDAVWNWYTSTFYTRQEGNGAIIIILTRWHNDDLVGRLLKKQQEDEQSGVENFDKWEVIRIPAIAERDEEFRKAGEPLWPWKYSLENLLTIKNTLGAYDWSSLYQQTPITSESQEFKPNWFKHKTMEDLESKNLIWTTSVDLAISTKESADKTVVCSVGKEPGNPNWYVYMSSGRWDLATAAETLFFHVKKFRSQKVVLETIAYQKAFKYYLEEMMRRRQEYFPIQELRQQNKNKEKKIRGILPLYQTGVVYHIVGCEELEDELVAFPYGIHDDHADALSMQLEVVDNTQVFSRPARQYTYNDLNSPI